MRRIPLFVLHSMRRIETFFRNFSSCIHRRHAKCVLFCGDGCHSRWLAHVRLILKPSYYWSTIIPLCNLRNWSIQKLKEYLNSSELIYSETEKHVFRTSSANSSLFFRTSSAELILCAVFCDSLLESMKLAIGYLHWSVMLIERSGIHIHKIPESGEATHARPSALTLRDIFGGYGSGDHTCTSNASCQS